MSFFSYFCHFSTTFLCDWLDFSIPGTELGVSSTTLLGGSGIPARPKGARGGTEFKRLAYEYDLRDMADFRLRDWLTASVRASQVSGIGGVGGVENMV